MRVPLNEDCWLGINRAPAAYSGTNYHQAIAAYVNLLNSNGLVAILDLHWNAPGKLQATGQEPMSDQDHAPAFWTSVASYPDFKDNPDVIFDLFNEPYPDSNHNTTAAWQCWRDGGTCPGVHFQAAGMQELVNTVRNTAGATNVIMLGGVQYANNLSSWLTYEPSDPLNKLVAAWHSYNFNACNTQTCWDQSVAPVVNGVVNPDGTKKPGVPLIAGEIAENDNCNHGYIDTVMKWMDSLDNGIGESYLAWTWDTWNDCSSSSGGYSLTTNYAGSYAGSPNIGVPTCTYGWGYWYHLAVRAGTNPPATCP